MNRKIQLLIAMFPLLLLAACGGGGGGSVTTGGGIGGTGLRVGPIAPEPGLVVGGVDFDAGTASVMLNGAAATSSDLRAGMVAAVEGTIASSGTSGVAGTVEVEDVVKGPVASILDLNNMVINGQTVQVDESTVYEAGISPASLNGVSVGDLLEVYGLVRGEGLVRATRIERESPPQRRRVTGFARNILSQTFTIGTITVNFANADVDDLPGGVPTDGMLVRVEADPALGPSGELVASEVKRERLDDDFGDNDDSEIEGFVTSIVSPSQFMLGGTLLVQTSAGTVYERGTAADLVVGAYIEVKGGISGGTLLAVEIEFEASVKIEADIATLPGGGGTFTLAGLPGITVQVDGLTEYDENAASFGDLAVGDHVEVEARLLAGSTVIAIRVRERSADTDIELQGPVDVSPAPSDPFLSILGVGIDTSPLQNDDFEGVDETVIGRSAFFAAVSPGTIVKVQGDLVGGLPAWDEAELEGEDD